MALNPYTGQITYGQRNGLGGENATWGMVNGQEVPVIKGDEGDFLLSDLLREYGSIENIGSQTSKTNTDDFTGLPKNLYNTGIWGARQNNDTFSGKDGFKDILTILAMAMPVIAPALAGVAATTGAGAAGAAGTAEFGAAAGAGAAGGAAGLGAGSWATDAALAGGGEVGSGYAASAPGWGATGVGTAGSFGADAISGGGGTGTDAMVGGGNSMDIGGGLTLDEFGNTTGGLFEGGPGTADAGFGGYGSSGYSLSDIQGMAKELGITPSSVLKMLGRAAPGLLGAYASNKQTVALEDMAKRYEAYGSPSRDRYEASMTPGFDPNSMPGYAGAVDTASKSLLARLSASGGNPFGNPGGLIDANKQIIAGTALPAIQAYQNQNANVGFGGTLNSAGSFGGQAIGSQANTYNAIGAGINDAINPPKSLAEQMAAMKAAGLFSNNSLG